MKKSIFIFVLILTTMVSKSFAVGIGIEFMKDPNIALTLKSGNSTNAYDAALSWGSGVYLHADYLHNFYIISRRLPIYLGLGLKTEISNNFNLGMRIPIGFSIYFSKLEFFLEVVPTIDVINMSFEQNNFGVGLRYNFKL